MTSEGENAAGPFDAIDILLVEPNPGDTRLFTENIADAKLTNDVYTVTDGESALEFLHRRGDYESAPSPDLLILEPQLPGIDGVAVLSKLENDPVLSELSVIVLTSSDAGEDIARSHGLEADYYLRKPIEPEDFVEFAQLVEDFWLTLVQNHSADDD